MLDMGFIPDVEKIVSLLSPMRTTLFFSATMPPEIRKLADKFLSNPKEITVSKPATAAETITQGLLIVSHQDGKRPGGGQKEKRAALRKLIERDNPKNALIFCNRKRDVDVVWRSHNRHGFVSERLHGDMVQSVRMETLAKFKNCDVKFMVCSDVAARGLDIAEMSHVFNFDVPTHADDYVHRIGRTGRAGHKGHAYTLATPEDTKYLKAIEQITGHAIPEMTLDGIEDAGLAPVEDKPKRRRRGGKKKSSEPSAETKTSSPEEKPAKETAKDEKDKPKRHKRNTKPDAEKQESGKPIKGLGDHVPAFINIRF
jgi:superfamily II DNA/RNA helicase